jgi:hypothetical protein
MPISISQLSISQVNCCKLIWFYSMNEQYTTLTEKNHTLTHANFDVICMNQSDFLVPKQDTFKVPIFWTLKARKQCINTAWTYMTGFCRGSLPKNLQTTLPTCDAIGGTRTRRGRREAHHIYYEGSSQYSRRCGSSFIGADTHVAATVLAHVNASTTAKMATAESCKIHVA